MLPSFNYNFGPSRHIRWNEFGCKDGTAYPFEWRANRAIILAELFELIRTDCGNKPIKIHSAYRTPTYNYMVDGVTNSQHLYGRALDLGLPRGINIHQFHQIIVNLPLSTDLKGIGKYKTFVHIDIRPTVERAYWDYS